MVEDMLAVAKTNPNTLRHLPDERDWDGLNRKWLADIVYTVDKVKFENFSEWYNEGGFETAPWLELLDLNKWVLADQMPIQQPQYLQQQQTQDELPIPPTPDAAINPSESDGVGLTPGHEAIKALWATPKVKTNGSLPNTGDCPPAPDDDHLFDLDIVDAEEDAMASYPRSNQCSSGINTLFSFHVSLFIYFFQ